MPININPVPSLLGNVATGLEAFIGGYGSGYGGKSAQMQQSGQARIDAFKPMQAAQVQTQGFLHDLAYQQQAQNFRMDMHDQANVNAIAKQDDRDWINTNIASKNRTGYWQSEDFVSTMAGGGGGPATGAVTTGGGTGSSLSGYGRGSGISNRSSGRTAQCGPGGCPDRSGITIMDVPEQHRATVVQDIQAQAQMGPPAPGVPHQNQITSVEGYAKANGISLPEADQILADMKQQADEAAKMKLKGKIPQDNSAEVAKVMGVMQKNHPEFFNADGSTNYRGDQAMIQAGVTKTKYVDEPPPPNINLYHPETKKWIGFQDPKGGIHYYKPGEQPGDQPAQPQLPPNAMLNPETGFVDKIVRGPAYAGTDGQGVGPPAQARIIPGNLSPTAYEIEYNKLSDGTRPTKKDKEGRWEYPSSVPIDVARDKNDTAIQIEVMRQGVRRQEEEDKRQAALSKEQRAELIKDEQAALKRAHEHMDRQITQYADDKGVTKDDKGQPVWASLVRVAMAKNPMIFKLYTNPDQFDEGIKQTARYHYFAAHNIPMPAEFVGEDATPPPAATQPAAGEIRVINGRRYRWDAATGTGVPVGG